MHNNVLYGPHPLFKQTEFTDDGMFALCINTLLATGCYMWPYLVKCSPLQLLFSVYLGFSTEFYHQGSYWFVHMSAVIFLAKKCYGFEIMYGYFLTVLYSIILTCTFMLTNLQLHSYQLLYCHTRININLWNVR